MIARKRENRILLGFSALESVVRTLTLNRSNEVTRAINFLSMQELRSRTEQHEGEGDDLDEFVIKRQLVEIKDGGMFLSKFVFDVVVEYTSDLCDMKSSKYHQERRQWQEQRSRRCAD